MKKLLLTALALLAFVTVIALWRATTYFSDRQFVVGTPLSSITLDETAAVERFAQALRFRTISHDDRSNFDPAPFVALHAHMQAVFPIVHARAQVEKVGGYSLLYTVKGSDTSLKPALFMGHMDVVPVDEATREQWLEAPFSGAITDGFVWGRGAIDDKVTVYALMEAMEKALSEGFTPKRTLYFAFGHDEEVGGKDGAKAIAAQFKEQGLQFEFVLDEGGAITEGLMAGISDPVAIIGIAEKGYVNLRLTARTAGGHSSQPPNHTGVGIVSQAIVNVEANPFDTDLTFMNKTFDYVGHYAPFGTKLAMANLWLLAPVVESTLLQTPSTAASLRTTIAATMFKGSSKSNILPTEASAVVNFRIMPGDSIDSITARVTDVVNDDRISIEAFMGNEPSVVSGTDSLGYQLIEQTIRRMDQEVLVAPYLVQGGTDAKHMEGLSDNIYRFMFVRLTPDTLKRFHGVNERIPVDDYISAVNFYYHMLIQSGNG